MGARRRIAINGSHGHIGSALVDSAPVDVDVVRLEADVRDAGAVERELYEAEADGGTIGCVVHCAAIVNTLACDVAGFGAAYETNVHGTRNVLDALRGMDAPPRFLYFSTTAIYDPRNPFNLAYTEESPIKPYTGYGVTKWHGEVEVTREYVEGRLDCRVVRPCFVYGGRNDHSNVSSMIRAALRHHDYTTQLDPTKVKDWLHVSDFCHALWSLVEWWPWNTHTKDKRAVHVFNVSRGTPQTFQACLDVLRQCDLLPQYLTIRPQDDYLGHHEVSNAALRQAFPDWAPRVSLPEGIDAIATAEGWTPYGGMPKS